MKRAISFFLCLIMCFSVFSATLVQVSALGAADKLFTVKSDPVKDGKVTYTVSLSGGVEGFGGTVIYIEYDKSVLSDIEFSPARNNSGTQKFSGLYDNGNVVGYDNVYYISYLNTTPEKVSANTEFFKITFTVIDDERPTTTVNFFCKEFISTKDADQSINVSDGLQLMKSENITTLEVPKPKSATLLTNAINFKWDGVVGATKYRVYRMTPTGAWGEHIAELSAEYTEYTDYNLESGNTYIYTVQALNDFGTTLRNSNGVSCKYISKPVDVVVESGLGGVDISWGKTNGADKYQIVRRELGETEWTVIAERSVAFTPSFKDTTVESGKTYEYDVNTILGSFVTDTMEEGYVVTYLTSPAINSAVNTADGIELKWENVKNAAYYVIYRRIVGVDTELKEYDAVSTNFYTDYAVEAGKTYTYSVQAVSSYGNASAFTKAGYSVVRVPSTVVTELIAQADNILVSWEAVEGVDGYSIYRKTEDSDWEKAGNVPKTLTSFEDKGAKSGRTYYYCVTPVIGNSESAKESSIFSVYYLKAPQNVKAVNTKDSINISWNASAGATKYYIFREDLLTTDIDLVGEVTGDKTECIDRNVELDRVYRYYVQAESPMDFSKDSEKTNPVKRIECVQKIKTEILSEGIRISWKDYGADSYIVYRKDNGVWTALAETTNVDYIDTTMVSGEIYAYSVVAVVDGFEGGIDEEAAKEFKYLETPSINKPELTSNSIKISWNKIQGAKTYELQRALLDSKGNRKTSYETITTVKADKSSYEDKNVKAGQGYIYRVYAVDGDDRSIVSGGYKSVFLATQSVKSLANAYGGVKVTWSGSTGAKNYRIYRKVSGGEWVFVKKVSSSTRSYVDKGAKNGVKTYYAVKAQNGDSISTYKSKSFTYFASPKATVSNKTSAITITWDKISGAKSYYVLRKGPGDKSWKQVAIVTKNIYTDNNVKAGKTYKYTVKAYNGKIFSAYNTDGWSIKRLSPPKLKSITNATSGVTIKWGKVTGASKYIVMRKVKGSSKWEEIATTKSTSFTDKTAKAGKIYTYTVKAGYSDYRSIYIADGLKIKRLSRPTLSSVKSAKKGITFKWKEVTGASGYLVYRKTGSGKWEEIAKVTGTSTVSYVDKTAKKGKTYYYSVRAYSGSYKSAYNTKGLKIKDKY